MSELREWPNDWPRYKQVCFANWTDACDMLVGPCSCGAWHREGEFLFEHGVLRKNGKPVVLTKEIKQ